jgi:hypothetical protein
MLLVMTGVAVVTALLPNSIGATIVLYFLVGFAPLVFFVTGAVFARGWRQAFALGAACAAVFSPNRLGAYSMTPAVETLLHIVEVYFQFALGGGLAVLARYVIESRGWNLAPPPRDDNPQK